MKNVFLAVTCYRMLSDGHNISNRNEISLHLQPETCTVYQIPYVLFTFYQIVKTRRLSLAYLLIWRKFQLMHLCRSVDVST